MGDSTFACDESKWLDDRCVGVLRNREDQAVGGFRGLAILMVAVVVSCAAGMVVGFIGSGRLLGCGELLECVVYPMGRGGQQK